MRRKSENALGTCKEKRCVYVYYSLHILYTRTYAMNMLRLLPARLSQYLITHTESILHSYVTCFISKLQETHLTISRHEVYAPCQRKPHWWYANSTCGSMQIRCAPSSAAKTVTRKPSSQKLDKISKNTKRELTHLKPS